jgi:hypothetical protein
MTDRTGDHTLPTGRKVIKSLFRRNIGGIDRTVRLTAGIVLFPTGLFLMAGGYAHGQMVTILGIIGLVTGGLGVCPLYVPLGISTAHDNSDASAPAASPQGSKVPGGGSGL